MEVKISPTYEALSKQAAEFVAELLNAKPNAVLGLATGSSPVGLYRELVRMHKDEGLDFSQVTTFNLDEYVGLPAQHPQSYHYFMHEKSLQAHQRAQRAHPYPFRHNQELPGLLPVVRRSDQGVRRNRYADSGDRFRRPHRVNEPTSSLASRTRLKTLARPTIEDNARFFDSMEEVPIYAITMGVGTILEARHLLLMANGENKSDAVAKMIEGPRDEPDHGKRSAASSPCQGVHRRCGRLEAGDAGVLRLDPGEETGRPEILAECGLGPMGAVTAQCGVRFPTAGR